MGKLEDVERELYKPGAIPRIIPRFFRNLKKENEEPKKIWPEASRDEFSQELAMKKKSLFRFSVIAFSIFVVGALALGSVFLFGFQKQNVTLTILAKDRVESGEKVTYQIFYKNSGRETLHDVELSFMYPKGAVLIGGDIGRGTEERTRITLEDIPPGKEQKLELDARLFGHEGEIKSAEATLFYRPESSSSRFVAKGTVETEVVRVPLVLTLNVPQTLAPRQDVTLVLDYSSNAEAPFENMSFGVQYPAGFEFVSADPAPTEDNTIWSLGTINPGMSGQITIHGTIDGAPAESKVFTTQAGVYDALTKEWTPYQVASTEAKISNPLLSIEEYINSTRSPIVRLGDELQFKLHYKNNLDVPLSNVHVEVKLSGNALDLRTLQIVGGAYNGASQSIVWNSASLPELNSLAPHAEGDLSFSIHLLNNLDVSTPNPSVESQAKIETGTVPQGFEGVDLSGSDIITAKIASRLVLSSQVLFRNPYLPNIGPLPPKVKEKTSYVVVWQLANNLNDLAEAEVRATLFPGALWDNTFTPSDSALSYDPVTGLIVWRVGNVVQGAGGAHPAPLVAFRISITPGEDEIGKSPTLLSNIVASAKDTFTGETLQIHSENLTTELKSDPTSTSKDWNVAQ